MTLFKGIYALIQKELLLEWRQKHTLFGVLLYVTCTVFVIYMMSGQPESRIWNALFWIAQLFVTVNTVAKGFLQESENRMRYYHTIVSPVQLVISKMIYNLILMLAMALISLGFFYILLGNPILYFKNFLIAACLGASALSLLFTFLSAIAAQARQNAALMAILGFPIAIPLLMILSKLTLTTVANVLQEGWFNMAMLMGGMSVLIFALSIILFPFLWKE